MQTAGEAAGLLALGQLNKVKQITNAKPAVKGLIYKAIGVFGQHLVTGGKVKKGNDLVDGAANALSVAGTSQIINAVKPGLVPAIGGYEQYPISGPGYMINDGDENPDEISGNFDSGNDDYQE